MTLFCVKDSDGNVADGFNQPLRRVEKPVLAGNVADRYEKTNTPGVVIDRTTGKMKTQLPDPTVEPPAIIHRIITEQYPLFDAAPHVQEVVGRERCNEILGFADFSNMVGVSSEVIDNTKAFTKEMLNIPQTSFNFAVSESFRLKVEAQRRAVYKDIERAVLNINF